MYELFAAEHIATWPDRPRVHAALFAALQRALDLPDRHLAADLLVGLQAWGCLDSSGNWDPEAVVSAPTEFTPDENRAWCAATHASVAARATTFGDRMCWEATIKELGCDGSDGAEWAPATMEGPFTFDEMDAKFEPGFWRMLRRFPVYQRDDVRPCDDGAESGHNVATSVREKLRCITADWPARVAAAFVDAMGDDADWDMTLATDDLFKAYRLVGGAGLRPARAPAVRAGRCRARGAAARLRRARLRHNGGRVRLRCVCGARLARRPGVS